MTLVHDHKANDCRARFEMEGRKIKCLACDQHENDCARSVESWQLSKMRIVESLKRRKKAANADQ